MFAAIYNSKNVPNSRHRAVVLAHILVQKMGMKYQA